MPRQAGAVKREHIEAFLVDLAARRRRDGSPFSPATVSNRYRGLQSFWKWAVESDEIESSPMEKLKPPAVPEKPVPLLSTDDLRRILKVCDGKDFTQRRDMAILRLFVDTPLRREELAQLTLDDVDPLGRTAIVRNGKGGKHRVVRFGPRTATAIDRYLRARRAHRNSTAKVRNDRDEVLGTALWLGPHGAFTANGIYQMVQARGLEAGLGKINPHQFRHTFAHRWQMLGLSESDLMSLAGWSSRQMLKRYASSAASERALESYDRAGFGDEI